MSESQEALQPQGMVEQQPTLKRGLFSRLQQLLERKVPEKL